MGAAEVIAFEEVERNRFESSQATHRNRAVGLYFGLLV